MTLFVPDEKTLFLVRGLQQLQDDKEILAFLRDILTDSEIEEFSGRLAVARALAEGKSQRTVAKETGVSIATVTRVNQWLTRGMGGYSLVIDRMKQSENHHHKA